MGELLAIPAIAALGSSGALGILSGISSVVGMVGAIGSANSAASADTAAAMQSTLEAGQTQVEGAQNQTQMKRELAKVLGENDVAIAAGGVDLSGGIAASSRAAATKQATDEGNLSNSDSDMRRALLLARARNQQSAAGSDMFAGLIKAAGIGINSGIDVLQRG